MRALVEALRLEQLALAASSSAARSSQLGLDGSTARFSAVARG